MTPTGRLQDQVCLITGATGIAAATAELAAREGARLFIASLVPEEGEALIARLRPLSRAAEFRALDLVQANAAEAAVAACVQRYQRLDALFNVVGISGRRYGDGPVHECSEEAWTRTMDVNVKTMFLMCRAALRQMLTQEPRSTGLRGAILNMASVLGFSPSPAHFAAHAYAASKGAVLSLSQSLAAYYAPHKIRVNVIAPALVRTPMSQRAQRDPAIRHLMKTKQPLVEDFLEPESVARAAVFLLSDDAAAVTGEVFTIDGGWCVSEGQTGGSDPREP